MLIFIFFNNNYDFHKTCFPFKILENVNAIQITID